MEITVAYGFSSFPVYSEKEKTSNIMKHVTFLETFLGLKIVALSRRLALKLGPKNGGNVHSPRTPHNLVGPEHKGF